jgi:hypothetical protein
MKSLHVSMAILLLSFFILTYHEQEREERERKERREKGMEGNSGAHHA